ncbi:MAG TPA: M50 family metallopeptidase [Polyangiales bacterium]|jgi:regulator of sigma E protease|nr:M50 family metallopeptidase [Polyangiales bacterium]
MQILVAIFGISLLVIVHEAGHYLVARAFGIRVTRFSIGFGPVLAKYQPKGSPTVFQVCAIPVLAYVMIAGMNPADEFDPRDPELYPNKGIIARTLTIFGGPFANYLAASVMLFVLALTAGLPTNEIVKPMIVGDVVPKSPAAKAGLREGDVILEADGKKIGDVRELIEATSPRPNKATKYVIKRGERTLTVTMTPRAEGKVGKIGVGPKLNYKTLTVSQASLFALVRPFEMAVTNLQGIWDLIQRRSTEGITGPVGMTKLVAEQASMGVLPFVWILVGISVALGLFNMLPFPALDGGRLMFLAYEVVTRRRPNEYVEATVHTVGLLFLLGVIALVTLRDVAS